MEEDEECQELECSICIQRYSDHRIPRNLICGHSFCTSCLELLMKDRKRCPECRTCFTESKASDLPINYPLLMISRIINHAKTDPNVYPELHFPLTYPSSERRQDAGNCNAHGSTRFFICISCSVWACHICVNIQHPDPPRGECLILSVEDAIKKMKSLHTKNLETCIDELNVLKKKLETDIGQLAVALRFLKFQNNTCDSGCNTLILSFENHSNLCKDILSDLNEIQDVLASAKDKVSTSITPQEIDDYMQLSNETQVSFENLLEKEKRRELPDLSLKKLLRGKTLKDLLKEGNPVFVERNQDSNSWSKIVLKDNKLHLYSLVDGSPPEDGISLPYDSVRTLVPKESPLLFMEIGWDSEVKGVCYVRMYGDTARGRNAIFLCSGERGKSYKNAKFMRVTRMGSNNIPILYGGDYRNDRGSNAFPVVDDITYSSDYVHEVKAGLFHGCENPVKKFCLGLFSICLADGQPGEKISSAFGIVEEGFDIIKDVSGIWDVTRASVMDCGLIIPM